MNLSPRLRKIADFVPNNSIVADIGTDHGHIPKYLIKEGISKFVIATDISEGSLQKTVNYIKEENLDEFIVPRLGDGLEPIRPFEVDALIIAGMGGLLIANILSESIKIAKSISTLILQPMVGIPELRKYLHRDGFKIIDEELVKEGDKYYEIIVAKAGLQNFNNEIDYEISPIMIKKNNALLIESIKNRIKVNESIISSLKNNESKKSKNRAKELETITEAYKEVLERWKHLK